MPAIALTPANRAAIHTRLAEGTWVVACLCAAWCDICTDFRAGFDRLAADHPDQLFLWIDIEDEAEVVGDFDVENFPTLLIEQNGRVAFFGAVEAQPRTIERLLVARTRALPPPAVPAAAPGRVDLLSRLAAACDP